MPATESADGADEAIVFLHTTWPDPDSAEAAGRLLLREGLAACVNIGATVRSIYRWNGQIEAADETVMTVKTRAGRARAATARIAALHPYDLPAVTAFRSEADGTSPAFAGWVRRETGAAG